ncbi:ABC transporter ATP-binding protein [Azospirillum soli]|uniref:ABC transporter ATP-binding protein n=1 Tax=Azospirillum soli TaxID=1304799 RepID=UPI001AE6A7C2|nr:ABC transporter ATP-binding protein [Azospirillum soli]MBP2314832.1 iron complex transport system ATP-binding protein [Azospirillum soli]
MTVSQDAALTVRGLHAGYGGRTVIERLSLPAMVPGRLVALVGPNAAGKSTLLRAMAHLVRMRGEIRLGGIDLARLKPAERAATIGFMPQSLPDDVSLSVLESVIAAITVTAGGGDGTPVAERALDVLEDLGVADLASRTLNLLSGGQKQVVSLAQAIACAPPVLLLDEPTSALDPARQFQIMCIVKGYAVAGRIVVAVMHDLALAAQWADEIVVLTRGRLHGAGPPADILTPGMLAEVYGIAARVERCSEGRLQILVDGVVPPRPIRAAAGGQIEPVTRREFR